MKFGYVMIFLSRKGFEGWRRRATGRDIRRKNRKFSERENLDTLFAVCDAKERLWFEFFLMTGMREQEVRYTYWSDVNLAACTIRVTHKPGRGWMPKAYKEREIPVPAKLVAALKAWKMKSDKTCNLVFPTAGCKPKMDFSRLPESLCGTGWA